MSTAAAVPVTREEELEGDEAWETLRRTGIAHLARDAALRFRAADGFSHSRALAFQATLALLPAIVAVVGLASVLEQDAFTRAVRATVGALAPGPAGDVLTAALNQGSRAARRESGETALALGGLTALAAGAAAAAQIERGANRIYGTERDRPFARKYLVGLGLALTAGLLLAGAVVLLTAGSAVREAIGVGDPATTAWRVLRWPLGVAGVVAAVSLLFEVAPRRRQPEPTWLAFGAAVSAALWLAWVGAFALYLDLANTFGATYGPVAGTVGLLLWAWATAVALLLGLAFAAQLEAVRAGVPGPRVDREENEG